MERHIFHSGRLGIGFLLFLLTTSLTNLIPDYLSLLETRAIIGYMARQSLIGHILALAVDLAATTLIFVIGLLVGLAALFIVMDRGELVELDLRRTLRMSDWRRTLLARE